MTSDFMPTEKFCALKSLFEHVWGKGTYLELKHCSDIKVWKRYCTQTLKATQQAIRETIIVCDDDWHEGISSAISHGLKQIQTSESFDELFQCFAATYVEISFCQIGFMPAFQNDFRRKLGKGHWRLDAYRSVQYVQNPEQRERANQRRAKLTKVNS
jgi:hypothetical protein